MTLEDALAIRFAFESRIITWRGPSPFFFAPIPTPQSDTIRQAARAVSYGWGVIPVEATIGDTVFTTSLFPKDDAYLLPLKDAVRRQANITAGDVIAVTMNLRPPRR
ncbi:DUF1905 domain-containing protein [Caulobacter sp. SLTY]|uniref:DUF1905 domain-containing protein n=1 Tax=Caulobacter sp. SLTY TaxID=2683262 RepID=UPI003211D15C